MTKRVFIIHGWDGYPEEGWFPWLKKELETRGFEVQVPAMPNTAEPKIEEWVPYLAEMVGEPDENTYFVGHSIGCQTILRYLAATDKKAGGTVLVAGWFVLSDLETDEEKIIRKPWIEMPINYENIKKSTPNIITIFCDNDPVVPYKENRKLFEERLSPKIIVEHDKGHFSGSDEVTELPSVLNAVLHMAK